MTHIKTEDLPHVGVLVRHPNPDRNSILLMTSENPYNWELIKS